MSHVTERHLLAGKLTNLPPKSSSVVRVFISSTFTDTICERNALLEHVYPRIQEFCNQHGLQFQAVDMRWGVREEAQDDHLTSDLCIKEIHKCQRSTVGPSFVLILGQKYGYRPFPAAIDVNEFQAIHAALCTEGKSPELLDKWFLKDCNVVPSVVRLVSISVILPHYNDKDNPELMEAAHLDWWRTFSQIQSLLRKGSQLAAKQGTITETQKNKYFISVTEDEARHGILQSSSPEYQICIQREITNLHENLSHQRAARYIDMSGSEVNDEAQGMLQTLRNQAVPKALPSENILSHRVLWGGSDGVTENTHATYLQEMGTTFRNIIQEKISEAVEQRDLLMNDPLLLEILQHLHTCKARCDIFHGREDLLIQIEDYIRGDSIEPYVIYGESGSGKTSLMAKAASLVHQSLPEAQILLRFMGTSPQSSHIEAVLSSLCSQICRCYSRDSYEIPTEYTELIELFKNLLKLASKKQPLVILLDSLDQLANIKKVSLLQWLPRKLPPHVKFLVSTIAYGGYECILEKLKLAVPECNITHVLPLGQANCFDIINAWLFTANRTLTTEQFQTVEKVFAKCSLPLFTKLVFEEICRWNSYTDVNKVVLQPTVSGMIEQLFTRMEVQHGHVLVKHSLSYITCAMSGISEVELEDLLSLDDDVLNEAFSFWVPPTRRIPDLLWTRMREDLGSYLVEHEADGVSVISWYHRQFKEAASKRYLHEAEFKKLIHSRLADFFLGKWASGKKKPFVYPEKVASRMKLDRRESEADRKVADQPLFWERNENGRKVTFYNKRKLTELPYHLLYSGRIDELTKTVIWSYHWIHAKITAYTPHHVLEDIYEVMNTLSESAPLKLLSGVIRRAAATLKKEPSCLPVETIGRLYAYKNKNKLINGLLEECQDSGQKDCALLPFSQCFDGPVSHLIHTLEGHSKGVSSIVFTSDSNYVYTASEDGTVACWDMSNGDRVSTIDVSDLAFSRYTELFLPTDDQIIVEMYKSGVDLTAYNTENGDKLFQIKCSSNDFTHNTFITKNYIIRKGCMFKKQDGNLIKPLQCLVNQKSFTGAVLSDDEKILLVCQGHNVDLYDLDTETRLTSLPGDDVPSIFTIFGDVVIIGYTISCTVSFYRINLDNNQSVSRFTEFKYQTCFPNVNFLKLHRYRQEVCDIVLSNRKDRIAVNLKKCHLFVLNIDGLNPVMLEWESVSDGSLYTDDVHFTQDDDRIVALAGPMLCVWSSVKGHLLTKYRFSTMESDRCTMCLAPNSRFVATASKTENNVHVFNLDKLEKDTGNEVVQRFKHPVDMVTKHSNTDKLYVKTYIRLDNKGGYPKLNHFGVQVWDVTSQKQRSFLPFDGYGKVKMMVAAPIHPLLALVVSHIEHKKEQDIYILNSTSGDLHCKVLTSNCQCFVFSQDGKYFMVESSGNKKQNSKVTLYSIFNGVVLVEIPDACSPVFTDESFCVCLVKPSSLIVINLENDYAQENLTLKGDYNSLRHIPGQGDQILAVSKQLIKSTFTVFDIKIGMETSKIHKVGASTILDVSQDGKICIDSGLTVYDLRKSKKLCHFSFLGTENKKFVKLTYDGRFVIWADSSPADCVKAADIQKEILVATVTTHCKVTSLDLMGNGYLIVVGCENGQVLPFRLHTDNNNHDLDLNAGQGQSIEINSVKDDVVALMREEERLILQQAMSVNMDNVQEKKSNTCGLL